MGVSLTSLSPRVTRCRWRAYGIVPSETETVVSQLARATFGGRGVFYYVVQAATMLILVLAANTAYADFPRLASIVARDRFLPRQFMTQGDRLAFSNGILILSALAGVLLVTFGGDTHALIPLYMIGVFVSFTLSQAGMVVHWRRVKTAGWKTSAAVNGFGALVTGVVLVIVGATKAAEGAWIIIIMIPVLVGLFLITRRHYDEVASDLTLCGLNPDTPTVRHVVIVPVGGLQQAVVRALRYARSLAGDVRAVYVEIDAGQTAALKEQWPVWGNGVALVVLDSPYRSLLEPLLEYIEQVQRDPEAYMTVVLPEFVPRHLWQHVLHNQHALLIKGALLFKPNVVVTSVPFHLGRRATVAAPAAALRERQAVEWRGVPRAPSSSGR